VSVAGGVGQQVLFEVGLASTVAVTVVITRIAQRALNATVPGVKPEQQTYSHGEEDDTEHPRHS